MTEQKPLPAVAIKYHTTDGKAFDTLDDAEHHHKKLVAVDELLIAVASFANSVSPTGHLKDLDLATVFRKLCEDERSAEHLISLLQKAIY